MTPAVGYTEMRDSGIEWVGKIPKEWKVTRMKTILQNVSEKNHPDATVLSLYRDLGVVPKNSRDDNHNVTSEDTSNYKFVRCGDLVINKMKAWQGSLAVSEFEGIVSPAYYVCKFISNSTDKKYLHYLLRCRPYAQEFERLSTGMRVGQWDLGIDDFLRIPVICPSISEQTAIAAYLDIQCAKIDEIIAEAKASIEDYKQWKASIIYEAVTKGLDPNAEMKDSGIEWMGEIPAGWALAPFKYVLTERRERNVPIKSTERLSLSIDLGVTLYSEKTTNLDRFKEDFKQYKIAYKGDLVMNSMNMIVGASGVSNYFGCVSPAYYTFYDNTQNHVTAKYCEYIFRSKALLRVLHNLGKGIYSIERGDDRVNTCRLKVPKENLGRIMLPLPSENIQERIVNYLNKMCAEIDTLVTAKQALIADLESYKKSLIYEVVTGKRRVC